MPVHRTICSTGIPHFFIPPLPQALVQTGALKERFEYMTKVKGKGKKKTIVAIARKLEKLMYTVMKSGTDYEERHFKAEPSDKGGMLMIA
jgi:hypothetical protein